MIYFIAFFTFFIIIFLNEITIFKIKIQLKQTADSIYLIFLQLFPFLYNFYRINLHSNPSFKTLFILSLFSGHEEDNFCLLEDIPFSLNQAYEPISFKNGFIVGELLFLWFLIFWFFESFKLCFFGDSFWEWQSSQTHNFIEKQMIGIIRLQ